MKKVLIVIDNAYSYAGTENVCNFMTESLGDFSVVDILSFSGHGDTFYPYKKVNKITSMYGKKFKMLYLRREVKAYDFVFVVSMGKLSFIIRWWVMLLNSSKAKFITCEHVALNSFSWWVKLLKINSFNRYNKVIVLTNEDEKIISKKNISVAKISNPIIYNNFTKRNVTKKILAIGRLEEQKNFSELIDIWSLFIKDFPDYQLLIAGEGSLKEILQEKIYSLNLKNSISLLGKVENVSELYKTCDFLVMTSLYEGLPLALLEAKSWSLPVISYDCPTGPREIIVDSVDGFLIPNNNNNMFLDKMKYLASDFDVILNFSRSTAHTHLDFDAKKISNQWLSLLN